MSYAQFTRPCGSRAVLVATPEHHPTESLLGYVLRLAETNGYERPRYIWNMAGVPRGLETAPGLPTEGLARILGRDENALAGLEYRVREPNDGGGTKSGDYKILDHRLGRAGAAHAVHLRLQTPAICPLCVQEDGFIDAFFDLALAVACPRHGCEVLRQCPHCEANLSWIRPGLLACACGGLLSPGAKKLAATPAVELAGLIQARLHRKHSDALPNSSGLPIAQLSAMPFSDMLTAVEALGTEVAFAMDKDIDATEVMAAAAQALARWPQGFYAALVTIGTKSLEQGKRTSGFRRQFDRFFSAMFISKDLAPHVDFMREEFYRFGQRLWDHGLVSNRHFSSESRADTRRCISKEQFCQRYRIGRKTLERLVRTGDILVRQIKTERGARRWLVDLDNSQLPADLGEPISCRNAGDLLGIPYSILKILRSEGIYQGRLRKGKWDIWYVDDLEAFTQRFVHIAKAIAPEEGRGDLTSITSAMAYKLRDVRAKADMITAVLDGRLDCYIGEESRLGSMLLNSQQLQQFLVAKRVQVEADTFSFPECAQFIGIDPDAVPDALIKSLLMGVARGGRIRITAASVNTFKATYLPLKSLADRLDTTCRRLLRICAVAGVPLVQLRRKSKPVDQPIVLIEHIPAIEEKFSQDEARQDRSRGQHFRSVRLERLKKYLLQAASEGAVLPRRKSELDKSAIAKACGFDRNLFYTDGELNSLLHEHDAIERAGKADVSQTQEERMQRYLQDLKEGNQAVPKWRGRANLVALAKGCGVGRNVFLKNPKLREIADAIG